MLSIRGKVFSCAGALALVLCAALISHPASAQALPPTALPEARGRAEGMTPQIEKIMRGMIDTYQKARNYSDAGKITLQQRRHRVLTTTEMPLAISFTRPNSLAVIGGSQSIHSDGKTLQIVLDSLNQYTSTPAPQSLHMEHVRMGAPGGGLDEGYPELLEFLFGSDVYEQWVSKIQSITLAQPLKVKDTDFHVIHYRTIHKAAVTLYIDAARLLLRRCDIDATQTQNSPLGPQIPVEDLPTVKVRYDLFTVRINESEPPAADLFAVKPPPKMKRVTQFAAQSPDDALTANPSDEPESQIGALAPAIEGKDLEGLAFKPADTKNKLVLLFFWSPYGGGESLSLIPEIEALNQKYKDNKNVLILGVTGVASAAKSIQDVMKAKQAAFRTVHDAEANLHRAFRIRGLPSFYFITPDGKLARVVNEIAPKLKEQLAGHVDELLKSSKPAAPTAAPPPPDEKSKTQ